MWDEQQEEVLFKKLIHLRREFHQYPELSGKEARTSAVVSEYLKKLGVEVHKIPGMHGLCGVIKGAKPGATIALRADMDALPVYEDNDVPYKSKIPGIMHACGHDGHMAILLGTATMLMKYQQQLTGNVKLIFQPAEEASPTGGADAIVKAGVLKDVAVIFGLHLWPDLPYGEIGIRKGPLMAASDRFSIKLIGRGSHAGQPHLGVDAITMAADVINGVQHILSRKINPFATATISIGSIHGGERYNVVAREVNLEGTVRTLDESVRSEMPIRMRKMLKGISEAQEGNFELNYQRGYSVLSNWDKPVDIVTTAAASVIGSKNVKDNINAVLAAEDFSRYLYEVPGAFFWLGCRKEGEKHYPLHNSCFDIDEQALMIGVKIMLQTALDSLRLYNKNKINEKICACK